MAYRAGTTTFKIIPTCEELITINKGFKNEFLPVKYDGIVGVELDINEGKYGLSLTKKEVLNHKGWLTAVEEDKDLLKEYRDIVFAQLKARYTLDTGMGFYVADVGEEDELRVLLVHNLVNYSDAIGGYNLGDSGSFLLVAPSGAGGATRKK